MSSLPEVNREAATRMWREYVDSLLLGAAGVELPFVVECFGDSAELADELLGEVMHGVKRGTSSLANEYAHFNEEEPKVSNHWVICDGRGEPQVIVKVVSVERSSFFDVDAQFAAAEGEGDLSLSYWRREHETFWRRTQAAMGRNWAPEITTEPGEELLLELFEVCWPPRFADITAGSKQSG